MPHTDGPIDHSVDSLLEGRVARRAEAVAGDAHLLLRSVPLTRGGNVTAPSCSAVTSPICGARSAS